MHSAGRGNLLAWQKIASVGESTLHRNDRMLLQSQNGNGNDYLNFVLSLLIALVVVSWQAYSAAIRNPVEALRYE